MATTINAAPAANVTAAPAFGNIQQLFPQAQAAAPAAPQDAFVGPAGGGGTDQLTQALGALASLVQQLVAMLQGGGQAGAGQAGQGAQAGGATGAQAGGATGALPQATGAASSASAYASASASASATSATSSPGTSPGGSGQGVFVVGDLQKFGGKTVRQGLEDMLRPTKGLKDRNGERTHSQVSPQEAQQVQALLDSKDPAVQATLATDVPNGKSLVI